MARKSPYTSLQPNESKGIIMSLVLHVGVVAAGYMSFPFLKKDPLPESPIILEMVTIDEITAAPPKPAPVEEPKPEPKKIEPEPMTVADISPPQPDQMPPPPDLKIKEEPKPPEKKVEPPPQKPKPPEKKKKDEWADLQSLVKDLEKKETKKQNQQQAAVPQDQAKILNAPVVADKATMTELDAIRAHIEACWRIDPGKEGIEDLSAEIKVMINPDGSVQQAQIVDMGRYFADSAFRTFANSARNAVLSCGKLPFSPQRYDTFKGGITFNFSPQGRIN